MLLSTVGEITGVLCHIDGEVIKLGFWLRDLRVSHGLQRYEMGASY